MEYPYTNIIRNVPRLPNSSANYWGGQSFWTHPYWPQPAHSHRQHSPTRAQLKGSSCSTTILSSTQGMSFWAQLEECHMLNRYPELNSRDTFWATTQGTPTSWPLRYQRSLVDHTHHGKRNTHILQHHRQAQTMRRQAPIVLSGAQRLMCSLFASVTWRDVPCRQATRVPVLLCWLTSTWRITLYRQAPHQYSCSTSSGLASGVVFYSLTHIITPPIQSLCLGSIEAPTIQYHLQDYYTQYFTFSIISLDSLVTPSLDYFYTLYHWYKPNITDKSEHYCTTQFNL